MSRYFFLIQLTLAFPVLAQPVAFGVKAGVKLQDDVTGFSVSSESKPYIVGPMVEFRLPLRLGIEVEALYSRLGYTYLSQGIAGSSTTRARANSWELPVLLKYRLPVPIVHPYVSGGVAPRYVSGTIGGHGTSIDLQTGVSSSFTLKDKWGAIGDYGVVVAGGVDFGTRHFRISPEVRYTRWNDDIIGINDSHGYHVNATQDSIRILVGLSFR